LTQSPVVIGRYTMFDAIGGGGMATVYLGRVAGAAGFSRLVAIKRMHPHGAQDRDFATMLVDEARLASRIRHPNVVPVLDVVRAGSELILVMEYVHGVSLAGLLEAALDADTRLPLPIVVRIMLDVLAGLEAAHDAKGERGEPLELVHRDISPHNLLVGVDGASRIIDFGIAKAARKLTTTEAGQIKGKLLYMAPEQRTASPVDRRTDVYAMGLVLWELVVGHRALEVSAPTLYEALQELSTKRIRPPSELVDVPPALEAVIMKALRSAPAERFATADAFAVALEAAGESASSKAVAAIVESLAANVLAKRTALVARVEALSMVHSIGPGTGEREADATPTARPVAPVSDTLRAAEPSDAPSPRAALAAPRPDPSALVTPDAHEAVARERVRRRAWRPAVLAVLASVVIGALVSALLHRAPPDVVPAASAIAPSATTSAPAPSLVDAAADGSPIAASVIADAPAASPSILPAPPAAPRPPTAAGGTVHHRAPNCDPPYSIDSRGIKIPRRECFRE
jgi:serine/threonine-protein kinase